MKTIRTISCLCTLLAVHAYAYAQGTAFTYQGHLTQTGNPANGLYEMQFALYDAVTDGTLVGTPVSLAPVTISNGLFTVSLDFGNSAFPGAARWLELSLNIFGSDMVPTTLHPRQPITATPYTLHAANAANLMSFINAPMDIKANGQRVLRLESAPFGLVNIIGGSNTVSPDVAGVFIGSGEDNHIFGTNYKSAIVGGESNVIRTNSSYSFIGGGADNRIDNNSGTSTIGGGGGNRIGPEAPSSTISGGADNLIQKGAEIATISGGSANRIATNGLGSVISGGVANRLSGTYSVIVGGLENSLDNGTYACAIGGGHSNTIKSNCVAGAVGGGQLNMLNLGAHGSTIAGGCLNKIEESTHYSTIAGGSGNSIDSGAHDGAIGGGSGNTITGKLGTIPGGRENSATAYAFAAGKRARANHLGSFVWADYGEDPAASTYLNPFSSQANNEFAIRATGGVRFVSAINMTNGIPVAGVVLAPGSGTWSTLSDRNAKENFAAANSREVLEKVAALPLSTWNYKAQDQSIRHIGPMAQDFKAAFGVGENDKTITTVDADGVALAAIQGLNQKLEAELKAKDTHIEALQKRVERLEELLNALAARN